jgi:hypothetical protein
MTTIPTPYQAPYRAYAACTAEEAAAAFRARYGHNPLVVEWSGTVWLAGPVGWRQGEAEESKDDPLGTR